MAGTLTFSSSAALVKRLGDELIRDPHTAFFELIKNSYDADATAVHVSFRKTAAGQGAIAIRDNGAGMTVDDLRRKWARAFSSSLLSTLPISPTRRTSTTCPSGSPKANQQDSDVYGGYVERIDRARRGEHGQASGSKKTLVLDMKAPSNPGKHLT